MKKLLMATALVALGSPVALANDFESTWYVSGAVGVNWADYEYPGPIIVTDTDTGFGVFGAVGYRFETPWRLELELGGRFNEGGGTFAFFFPLSTDSDVYSAMLNLIYEIPLAERTTFSIGAGAGVGLADLEESFFATDDEDENFAWQLLAELSFGIGERTDLFVGYRFFNLEDLKIQPYSFFVPDEVDYVAHTAMIGVRYYFGDEPAVAQPEPPADVAKTYIVFFDFNKSNLTAEAQSVVAEAAEAFKQTGSVRVEVVGHTDTVGSAKYNQRLSERRAASVAAELVRLGVPSDAITTEGRGFSDPMVPTGPGVREPQNRRAVIDLK